MVTVLIIDDDPVQKLVTKTQINRYFGNTVVIDCVSNGKEALEYFEKVYDVRFMPRIVFIDLNMPVINGWQLLDCLTQTHTDLLMNTSVYLWSCSESPADIRRSHSYEMVKKFLTKPVEFEEIKAIIKKHQEQQNHYCSTE